MADGFPTRHLAYAPHSTAASRRRLIPPGRIRAAWWLGLCLVVAPSAFAGGSSSTALTVREAVEVQSILTGEFGFPRPAGLTYVHEKRLLFLAQSQRTRTRLLRLTPFDGSRGVLDLAYDQQGQTDKAFEAWLTANQTKAERFPYDPDKRKQYRDSIIEYSQALATRNLTETPAQEVRQLVFVIGMPRSGTSLTDQILTSNSNVGSLGEVGYADEMAAQVKKLTGKLYPQGLAGLSQDDIGILRADYLNKIPLRHSDYQVLVDKTPMNFQFLGLLAEVFPNAKFIHCRRSPMDNCFSIFKLSFADHQEYAHELTALGHYYSLPTP